MEQYNNHSSPTTYNTSSSHINMTEINAIHYHYILQEDIASLRVQVDDLSELNRTSDNSSILHIAASTNTNNALMIDYIVEQSWELLRRPNSKGDLPVHVAVRAGHIDVVKQLVDAANQLQTYYNGNTMLQQVNCENNTALHIALENQQMDMSKYLFSVCPNVCNSWNVHEISPLYLAIKAGFWDLVEDMVEQGGDLGSRIYEEKIIKYPVIHAAIMAKKQDILEKIIKRDPNDLLYSMDEKGRRPLSYAAYIGFLDGVKCIINMRDEWNDNANTPYRNQAFKTDNDGSFPIHAACHGGHIQVIKELLETLPGKMTWLVNQKGQTILHIAAQNGKCEVVKFILRELNLVTMINMKDEDGYTPLHLGVIGKNPKVVYDLTWDISTKLNLQCNNGFTALDLAENYGDMPSFEERLTWLALIYAGVPRAPQQIQQNIEQFRQDVTNIPNGLILTGKTTFTVTENGVLEVQNNPTKHKHKYKERINTLLIISTLISTVTFASGLAVPGSYNNSNPKQGMATLDKKTAFQVYVIANTISLYSSVLAMVTLIWAHLDDIRLSLVSLDVALPLLGTALGTMSIAFTAGSYVVLQNLFWLSIVVLVIGSVFLSILLLFLIPHYLPSTRIKCSFIRYVVHLPFMLLLFACKKGENPTLY